MLSYHDLLLSLLLIACQTPPSAPVTGAVEHRILPSETNAAITQWNSEHFVSTAGAAPRGARQLLLVLAGTGGTPIGLAAFERLAAGQGYDVIGLTYANDRAVVDACTPDPDPRCMGAMRYELLTGTDSSTHVTVDRANGIEERLIAVLRYLSSHFPAERWDVYLSGGQVRWSSVAVAGFSQGGGEAAYIAKLHEVPRVVMLAAPADGLDGRPGAWVALGATPADRYFGFAHTRDPFLSIVPNWRQLGLGDFGPLTLVDGATSFGATHMLTTDAVPRSGSIADAHASVAIDALIPRNGDDTRAFDAAWRHILGTP